MKTPGYALIIIVEGQGLSEERTFVERNGKHYKRYFYLHNIESMNRAAQSVGLEFIREIDLPEEHSQHGWMGYLFQSVM